MLADPLTVQLGEATPGGAVKVLVEVGHIELGPEMAKTGVREIVMAIWSLNAPQGPGGSFEVSVSVTVPAAVSDALAV